MKAWYYVVLSNNKDAYVLAEDDEEAAAVALARALRATCRELKSRRSKLLEVVLSWCWQERKMPSLGQKRWTQRCRQLHPRRIH